MSRIMRSSAVGTCNIFWYSISANINPAVYPLAHTKMLFLAFVGIYLWTHFGRSVISAYECRAKFQQKLNDETYAIWMSLRYELSNKKGLAPNATADDFLTFSVSLLVNFSGFNLPPHFTRELTFCPVHMPSTFSL